MATLEEIVVQLTAETASLRAEMQTATKAVEGATSKMDSAIEEFTKNSKKNTGFFQQAFATMTGFLGSEAVLGVVGKVGDAIGFVAEQLVEAGQEAIREEQAFATLSATLASSGKYSKAAGKELQDFANDMEGLAQTSADVIASNLALLSSMTKLSSGGLKQAETAAINLSAAYGKDLGTATEIVAKAINGQEMGLKKLGIELNLTSDKTKNLEMVTAALAGASGSAQARMNTFAGTLFMLKDAWGDMFKEVSKAITQNDVVISVMQAVAKTFSSFTEDIKKGGSAVRDGIGKAMIELLDVIQGLVQGLSTFFKYANAGFSTMMTGVSALFNGFMALGHALDGNTDKAEAYWDKIVASANATDEAWKKVDQNNFLDTTAAKIGELKTVAEQSFDVMVKKPFEASKSQEGLQNSIQKTTELSKEQLDALKQFATGLASQQMAIDSQYQFSTQMLAETNAQRQALLQDDYAAQITAQQEFFALQQELRDAEYQKESDALATARANNLLTEQQYNDAKVALAQKYALDNAKQQTAMTQFEAQQQKTRQENFKSTMGTISSLSSSGNKELAAIGKAAAITNATIDGYAAVQKALASAPPPFNFALAALVGAATAANVAKIAGVPGLKSGITEVPKSAGGGNGGDNFPAMLNPGERVVDSQTNQDLKEFLARSNGGGGSITINVNIAPGTGINREQAAGIVEAINDYVSAGGLRLLGAT